MQSGLSPQLSLESMEHEFAPCVEPAWGAGLGSFLVPLPGNHFLPLLCPLISLSPFMRQVDGLSRYRAGCTTVIFVSTSEDVSQH